MIKPLLKYLLVWRLLVLLVAVLAALALPVKDCCYDFGSNLSLNYLSQIWANFAGSDFLDLAANGYGLPLKVGTYVFFPLFPALIRQLASIVPDYLASGLVVAHLSLIAACYYLIKLIKIDHHENVAWKTVFLLLVFPTSFFFGAVYTESFFLLVTVLTFYLVRRDRLFLSCIFALLASATRISGIFIWPALIWEFWLGHHTRVKKHGLDVSLVWLLLPPLGILSHMKYLLLKTGDPFYFLKVSPDFGPNLVITKLILLHQVVYRYLKMIIFSSHSDITFAVVVLELLIGILFLVLSVIAFNRLRLSYAIFMLLSFAVPTFGGTFTGQPRFALTLFPGFILLALWFDKQKPITQKIYLGLNLFFAVICIALFTRGYFVS